MRHPDDGLNTMPTRAALLVVALIASACGGMRVPGLPGASGNAGFDTSIYPGDSTMRAWRHPASPYRWVGYYLQSPCRRDSSWNGTRERLENMGWGIAVLYVGQQAWAGSGLREDTLRTAPVNCSRSLLTEARGIADADDAISRAMVDGFPTGTAIFLDVERMSAIPDSMTQYYSAWLRRVWSSGRYSAGLYVHRANALEIRAQVESIRASYPGAGSVRWWIAGGTGFSIDRAPTDVGFAFADIWQGFHNVRETWNGVTLNIDANVASRRSPSAP